MIGRSGHARAALLQLAARYPLAYSSIICCTVRSSAFHGVIMGVQSLTEPMETGHLIADVPALLIVAVVLGVLMLRTEKA